MDATDWLLLGELQRNAGSSNQTLAERANISPATCLRRIKRLRQEGLIAAQVALLNEDSVASAQGHGLTAIAEVSLDRQGDEHASAFEARAVADPAVMQCYRVTPGPDFVLVIRVRDMPGYHSLAQSLFTQHANVRNVKVFFSVKRGKFETQVPLQHQTPTDRT